jgi:hypothetical protein
VVSAQDTFLGIKNRRTSPPHLFIMDQPNNETPHPIDLPSLYTHMQKLTQQVSGMAAFLALLQEEKKAAATSARPPQPSPDPGIITDPASSTSSTAHFKLKFPSTIQLSTFKGNDLSKTNNWLNELENTFTVMKLEDTKRVEVAVVHLKEAAITWWNNVKATTTKEDFHEICNSWEKFKAKFKEQYQPIGQEEISRRALHNLKQYRSVQEYITTFLNHLQNIPTMDERQQLFYFKNGLKSEIQEQVELRDAKALPDAMVYAQKAEARRSNRQWNNRPRVGYFPSSSSSASSSSTSNSGAAPMELGNMASNDNETGEEDVEEGINNINVRRGGFKKLSDADLLKYKKEGRCFRCGVHGHLSRHCPERAKQAPSKNF